MSSESWLERQKAKRSRRTFICWAFWLLFFSAIAGIVIAILYLKSAGVLGSNKQQSNSDSSS